MSIKEIKTGLVAVCMLTGIVSLSFTSLSGGSVHGTVTPPESGLRAFLFSGKDTLAANVNSGVFRFANVKPGSYKLLVEAAPPYRNAVKDGINVTEGEITDAGQVELQK